jgi:PKD repeat protein
MLNQDPINAAFNYTLSGNTVQFENTSYNSAQYQWYFGDGDSSILSNPTHIFINGGSFTVQLMASNNCYSDTITLNINIPNSISITSEFDPEMMIYPNPSNGLIQFNSVSGIGEIYKLYNSTGLLIKSGKIESLQLDFTNISKGLYYLEISNQIQKIIFQ